MTQLLIRWFVKNYRQPDRTEVRTAYGNLAGIVGIVCNVILFAGKFAVGTLFGSIAITADAINNLSDASSNVVSLLGFRLGAKKPDEKHPYGYARYEYIAGLAVSVMILAIGISLLKESVGKVFAPEAVEFSILSVGVLLVSIAVKLWMSVFNRKIGETIRSDTLIATAADSRNDVISTAAVLAAAILTRITGIARLDGIVGVAVALFILIAGIGLVRDTLSPLLGESPDPALVKHIEEEVMSYPGVMGIHDLMVHDYGPGQQFASLHIEFPAEADVLQAHDLIDNIEKDLLSRDHILTTIHYDPIVTRDAEVAEVRHYLEKAVAEIESDLTLHDLRLVPGPTHTNVLFDLVLPAGYKKDRAELVAKIKQAMKKKDDKYICVIQLDRAFTSAIRE